MLKILSFFFPSIKTLIKIKIAQDKLIEALENKKTDEIKYTTIDPFHRGTAEAIQIAAALWNESNTLKYLIYSIKQELVEEMIKGSNAEEIKYQLIGIDRVTKIFEGYVKKNEQLQILQNEGTG